jgi:hypothetical protein
VRTDEIAWKFAWEAAMAEAGYPHARLFPEAERGHYTWETGTEGDGDAKWDQAAWEAGMRAQVLCDRFRPHDIQPSIALARRLNVHSNQVH